MIPCNSAFLEPDSLSPRLLPSEMRSGPDTVTGMDFVILDGDKISQLYAFVERSGD